MFQVLLTQEDFIIILNTTLVLQKIQMPEVNGLRIIWQEAKNRTLQETHLRNYIKEMEDYDSALFKGH